MTDLLLVYITCKDITEAKKIGKNLLKKKLCACVNIIPEMYPMYFWPPKSKAIIEGTEAVLIAKTFDYKYDLLEKEVEKIHSYDTPCIIAIPAMHVNDRYFRSFQQEFS